MRLRAAATLAAASVLVGALAGCAGEAEDEPVMSSGIAAVQDAYADADPTEPATWVIGDGAVGEVRLGADFAGVVAAPSGDWRGDGSCEADWSDDAGFEVTVSAQGGQVAQIVVVGEIEAPSQGPRTADGIGLGSTRDEVRAVYPTAEETAVDGSDVVELRPAGADLTGAELSFEVAGTGRVIGITLADPNAPADAGC